MRRVVTAALATLALSAALAGPAFAGKPVIEPFEFSGAFDINCGTFTLHEEFTAGGTTKTWLDANGDPTRMQVHNWFKGTITGPGGVLTLSDPGHWTDFFTFGPDGITVRQAGQIYNIHVKGQGLILHDVGSITFLPDGSVVVKGPHDVWENGLEALICPLFE